MVERKPEELGVGSSILSLGTENEAVRKGGFTFLTMTSITEIQVGDLLISHPIKEHIGVVINVEPYFYRTWQGDRQHRITVFCQTFANKITYVPLSSIDGKEAAWVRVKT